MTITPEQKLEDMVRNSPLFFDRVTWAVAFFKGPLFPFKYENKLCEFYDKTASPLQVLEEPDRREALIEVLERASTLGQIRPSLFSMDGQLPELLDELYQQGHLYQRWFQKTKGKGRSFAVPQKAFRTLLQDYVLPFVKSLPTHPCCHGGEKGWSVRKSLETHLPVLSWVSFDMESAFYQVEINHVFNFFYDAFEELSENEEQRTDAAAFLASLCTVKETLHTVKENLSALRITGKTKNFLTGEEEDLAERYEWFSAHLPIGSPVSMALFNRIMYPIDAELERRARKKGMRYSRWVDDFILTSPKRRHFGHFAQVMRIAQQSFSIAPEKVFFGYFCPAYLLGHEIRLNEIQKLDKEEFRKRRGNPVDNWCMQMTHPGGYYIYEDWGGNPIEGDEEVLF